MAGKTKAHKRFKIIYEHKNVVKEISKQEPV